MKVKIADRNLIDPDVTEMAPCARCGELVRLSRTHCPACGVAIDPEELYPAAMEYARVTKAISAANTMRSARIVALLFTGLAFWQYSEGYPRGLFRMAGFLSLAPLTQVVNWFFRYGGCDRRDAEYAAARREMWKELALWIAVNLISASLFGWWWYGAR